MITYRKNIDKREKKLEVAYFYAKNYLGLEEKEYNFHGKYNFSFNSQEGIVVCNEIGEETPKDFFGERVISVNAIVGKNGSGKTRILKFLYEHLNRKIQVIKLDGFFYKFDNWIDVKNELKYIILFIKNKEIHITSNINMEGKSIECNTYYYSNVFDYDVGLLYRDPMGNNFKNLSISEEIFKKSEKFKEMNEVFTLGKIKLDNDIRQIKFIRELQEKEKNQFYEILKQEISIPEEILFRFSYLANENRLSENLKEKLNNIYKNIDKTEGPIDFQRVAYYIRTCIIINLLTHMGEKNISYSKIKEIQKRYKYIENNNIDTVITYGLMSLRGIEYCVEKKEIKLKLNMSSAIILIELCEEVDNKEKSRMLKKNQLDGIKIFIARDKNILNYSWNNYLSSGEKAMLRLFSILYKALENSEGKITLLIDELDATFHPEWQRKSLNLLLIYLNNYSKLINSNISFQLVISSHSPFLVADIPKEKIVVLDKNGSQEKKVNLKAFGSNILDIYKEGLFLETTFGEFAKEKIKKVIKLLSKKNSEEKFLSNDEKNEIKFIIMSIGEPLIRNRLEKIYDEHIKESITKKEKIERIKQKIKIYGLTVKEVTEEISDDE